MTELTMPRERITRGDIEAFKREVLEQSVLVTPRDAAQMLSCSPRTVLGLVQDGKINAYNGSTRGKGLRLMASELRDYVRSIRIDREKWME
jgi:excisionase family DNA binding protein